MVSQDGVSHIDNTAIIFLKEARLKGIFRTVLQEFGILNAIMSTNIDDCISRLVRSRNGLFVLNADIPIVSLTKILDAAQGAFGFDTRPIYLIVKEMNEQMIPIMSDYSISKIGRSPLTVDDIRNDVSYIIETRVGILNVVQELEESRKTNDQVQILYDVESKLKKLCQEKPKNIRFKIELAAIKQKQKDWDAARRLLEPVVRKNPRHSKATYLLAKCYLKKKKFQDASVLLKKANLLNPYDPTRLIDFGHCLLYQNDPQKAKERFEKALELDEKNNEAQQGVASSELLLGAINEGLDLVKQFSDPRDVAAVFNNSGVVAVHNDKIEQALELYKIGETSLKSENQLLAKVKFNKALAYMKSSQWTRALMEAEEAQQLDLKFKKLSMILPIIRNHASIDEFENSAIGEVDDELENLDDLSEHL